MRIKTQNKAGGVLVLVMVLVLVLGGLGVGLMKLGDGTAVEVSYAVNDANAFWAAEAGMEHFKAIIHSSNLPLDLMTPNYLG